MDSSVLIQLLVLDENKILHRTPDEDQRENRGRFSSRPENNFHHL